MNRSRSDVTSQSQSQNLGRLYPVILAPYNPLYPQLYAEERLFLLGIFGDSVLRISHIGSTAVPGLLSKPTIDILIEVKTGTELEPVTRRLTQAGYIVNNPPSDLIMYIKGYGEQGFEGQTFHVHVRNFGDCDELYFRDYLLTHPDTAREYGELKKPLQKQFEYDRDGYTYAKSEFVLKVTQTAKEQLHR